MTSMAILSRGQWSICGQGIVKELVLRIVTMCVERNAFFKKITSGWCRKYLNLRPTERNSLPADDDSSACN